MAKKAAPALASSLRLEKPARAGEKSGHRPDATRQKPSSLLDTRVVYCGDNLKRSHKVIVALTVPEILDEHIAKKLV